MWKSITRRRINSKMKLTDKQILLLCILFPISNIIGPIGILVNIFVYLVIFVCITTGII